MKDFIITIDTEGDNLWHWQPNQPITTENARYIPRFQELCESFGFRPVYLTNYEMAQDPYWTEYASRKAREGKCEIGMHLHAWNTPPQAPLKNKFGGNPYITEYPDEIMDAKVETMMNLLQDKFEQTIVSHRSGRWATNRTYFCCLARHGIKVDCSVTPELDLSSIVGCEKKCGNDYRKALKGIYYEHAGILEVPMTTRRVRHWQGETLQQQIKMKILGEDMWLRPLKYDANRLKFLTEKVLQEENCKHLEFMIHSSELMPGGSPYFPTQEAVEKMFETMEDYFRYISQLGAQGKMLREIWQEKTNK